MPSRHPHALLLPAPQDLSVSPDQSPPLAPSGPQDTVLCLSWESRPWHAWLPETFPSPDTPSPSQSCSPPLLTKSNQAPGFPFPLGNLVGTSGSPGPSIRALDEVLRQSSALGLKAILCLGVPTLCCEPPTRNSGYCRQGASGASSASVNMPLPPLSPTGAIGRQRGTKEGFMHAHTPP